MPGRLITSGMIWCSRSMKVITTIAEQKRKSTAKGKRRAEFHEQEEGQQAIEKLDQGVLDGDAGLAGAAFAAENEVAENGDIVVPGYPVIAGRAVGRREDDGFVLRQTAYADIQERTDHGAEDKGEDVKDDDRGHCSHKSGIGGYFLPIPGKFLAEYLPEVQGRSGKGCVFL